MSLKKLGSLECGEYIAPPEPYVPATPVPCQRCNGEGFLTLWGVPRPDAACGACNGTGEWKRGESPQYEENEG